MFTPFRLEPCQEWAHIVQFANPFGRDDEKEYRLLESEIRSDINSQRQLPENKGKLCETNIEAVAKLKTIFNRHFKWAPGEYNFELRLITDQEKANIARKYRFSLFESESQELFKYSEMYKTGAGVYWVSTEQPGIFVPVHEA